jgi:hypothetical protein
MEMSKMETREEIEQLTNDKSFNHPLQVVTRIECDIALLEHRNCLGVSKITEFKNKLKQLERKCYAYKWSKKYSEMDTLLADLCMLQKTVNDHIVCSVRSRAMIATNQAHQRLRDQRATEMDAFWATIDK